VTAVGTRARPVGRARPSSGSTRSAGTRTASSRSSAARRPAAARSTSTSTRSRTAVRSLPQETTGPRLRVLPRRRVSGRTLLGLSAALFFVVLAGSVTIQAQRIEAQHRIDQLDAELLDARDLHRELRAEVAVAESPERIMAAARELGMVEPGPVLPLLPPAAESIPATTVPVADGTGSVEVGAGGG
jgi:cell division protein FtsL